jgi:tetratricopeptide (TPR) repeat protein
LAPLFFAAVLSAVSVYAVDRIERMTDGPAPADHSLLRVVFLSGWFVLGIFSWAIVAGHGGSWRGLILMPLVVGAILLIIYGFKAHSLRAAARLRKKQFEREVAAGTQAIARDPANAAAHARLAEVYEESGDLAQAVEHGRRVCELEPSEKNRRRLAQLERQGQD